MFKKLMWYILSFVTITITTIFIVGFTTSLAITTYPTPKKVVETPKEKTSIDKLDPNFYNILVMGDSLAKGTGDESGNGFAMNFATSWKAKTTKKIKVNNIAVNGDVSTGLLKIIEKEQTLSYISSSNIIFISIGGNEITQFKNNNIIVETSNLKTVQDNYLKNLKDILKIIRSKNSSCLIAFIGLYNPFNNDVSTEKINFINTWNYQTQQLISTDPVSIFIPTYDLFEYNSNNYLSVDNFHPNSAGYEAISNRIVEDLKNYK